MFSRVKIASLVTVLALGALAAVALASGSGGNPAAVQTTDDVPAKPRVRTEIVHQTVHRRAKTRAASAGTSSGSSGAGGAVAVPATATPDDHGRDDDRFDDHGADDAFDDHGGDDRSGSDDDSSGRGGGEDGGGHGRGRGGDDD